MATHRPFRRVRGELLVPAESAIRHTQVRKILTKLTPELISPDVKVPAAEIALNSATEAYRRLAKRYHPDVGGNAQVMSALNELWQAVQADIGRARN